MLIRILVPNSDDNQIWLLKDRKKLNCIVVDPGKSDLVLSVLEKEKLCIKAILITHYHLDHVSGIQDLLFYFKKIPVYGPKEAVEYGVNHVLKGGNKIHFLNREFLILSLPGHTLGHIGFYSFPYCFCGDTVFTAGCGKIFEGTSKQMYFSVKKISQLPFRTMVLGGHNYMLKNLFFAFSIFPKDFFIKSYLFRLRKIKNNFFPITTVYLEKKINIFFRCHEKSLQKEFSNKLYKKEWEFFSDLRRKKDFF